MKAKWYFLGCLTSVVLVILFIILSVNSLVKMTRKSTVTRISENSVLHVKLSGQLNEYSLVSDTQFKFVPSTSHDLIQKINKASSDDNIRAILLQPEFLSCGYATANEIKNALLNFKQSGKKIYGYISMAGQKDIFLLSVADVVYINPSASAGILLHGMGGNIAFYKDMLEKLGVQIHIIRAGDYKSAGESLSRSNMSKEFKENISLIFDDLYLTLLKDMSDGYNKNQDSFKYLFENREKFFINLEKSKEFGLVSALGQFDELLKEAGISEKQLVKISNYNPPQSRVKANQIAVVYALGAITSSKAGFNENNITSSQYLKIFDEIEKDNSIKAVVIRVNSPGGSALESDIIYNRIEKLRLKKPVVISMGDIAASGGYYISANSNYIFADPYTITGSIGVVSMIPDLKSASKKLGINTETVGHGKFLKSFDMWNGYSRDFERAMQKSTDDIYNEFLTRVSEGRKIPFYDVKQVAQGKIWSAQRALEYNLIDEIGLLGDAINKAANLVFAEDYSVSYYPKRQTFLEFIMKDNFDFPFVKAILKNELPESFYNETSKYIDLFNEIEKNPIQMKMDYLLEVQ